MGSPLFFPPELINGIKYSYKGDIWSVGIILYILLVGKIPFVATSF